MNNKNKIADFLTGLFKKQSKRKTIENAVIVVIIGIVTVIAGSSILSKNDNLDKATTNTQLDTTNTKDSFETEDVNSYEKDLKNILSRIKGVGGVDVMITFTSTSEEIPAFQTEKSENGTNERDSGGGTREINQSTLKETIIYEEVPGGGKKPVVVKKILPEVKGVVVAADGASNPIIKESICKAVQALLDVPIHKVQVFERE